MNKNTGDNKITPPEMCPECQKLQMSVPMKYRQGGISKDGKSYTAFYGCTRFPDCRYTWKPAKENETQNNGSKIMLSDILRDINEQLKELRADIKDLRD